MHFFKFTTILILIFLVFSGFNVIHSQTIVNTEKLLNIAKKGGTAGVELNFDYEQGNSDIVEINGKSLLGYGNETQSMRLMAGLRYLSKDKNRLIYRNFIHLRHNYNFTESIRSFSFYQLQRNNSLLLKRRQLLGAGFRKVFKFADSLKFDVGSGLMYENEILSQADTVNNESKDQSTYRMTNIVTFFYLMKPYLSILNALYFQPNVSDFGDYRLLNELSFLFAISKNLKLDISAIWRHDSHPPLGLKRNDISIQTGIVITFHKEK